MGDNPDLQPPANSTVTGSIVQMGRRYAVQQRGDGKAVMVRDLKTLGYGYDARAVELLADAAADRAPLTIVYRDGRGEVLSRRPTVSAPPTA